MTDLLCAERIAPRSPRLLTLLVSLIYCRGFRLSKMDYRSSMCTALGAGLRIHEKRNGFVCTGMLYEQLESMRRASSFPACEAWRVSSVSSHQSRAKITLKFMRS